MKQFRIVAERDERRRICRRLSDIEYFQTLSLIRRRLNFHRCVRKHVVEHACRNTSAVLFMDVIYQFVKFFDTLTRLCRNKDNGRVRHIFKVFDNLFSDPVHRLIVFFDNVPLVDDDDGRFSATQPERGTDIAAVAKAFGVKGMRIKNPSQAKRVFKKALSMDKPVVIDCRIDPDCAVLPMIPPGGDITTAIYK